MDSLMPPIERAVGLRFTHRPFSAMRSRQQVRTYVLAKLEEELPTDKARGIQAAYRLLGLLPDTLELRALLLDLLTEQIAGYYEPDSSALFMVAGDDPAQLRLVLAHEMVHALQHQYVPLDSIMKERGDNDRVTAAQAIFEGQATLAGLQVMVPKQNLIAMPEFWETFRTQIKTQQASMAVFKRAPRIVREELIFPYLAGADFMRWWAGSEHRDTVPFGRFLPTSTEQILHPSRYGFGDQPIRLQFRRTATEDHALWEDDLGEFEIRVLTAELAGAPEVSTAQVIGWGGDRYRVYQSPEGTALVWYTVWDDSASAERFRAGPATAIGRKRRLGYRLDVTWFVTSGHPGVRVVLAP
ncbi:MAG TPA: DUF6782 family putative metallopeptidase, partial [Streptosporangiaceae bacterium]|nr:DUF6782 family putative metallopeptidase [Streptosporangiaceae bacterium]